jgi:hypothetical protein
LWPDTPAETGDAILVSHRTAFITRERSIGAKRLVRVVRQSSKIFRADPDSLEAANASVDALRAMVELFNVLRNEQDHGRAIDTPMNEDTGLVAKDVTQAEMMAMHTSRRIDRTHRGTEKLTLRDALNKIAHYNPVVSTYRVDGRRAHYMVLGGQERNKLWVAEFLVSRFCRNATAAIKAL